MKKFLSCFNKGSLVLFIFGILIICLSAMDMFTSLKPAVSFQDIIDGEEVKEGTHVAGNVVYAMDYFASESSYTKYSDGSRSGSKKSGNYYLIPTASGYIGLKSREADVSALNDLSDETFEFISGGAEPKTEIFMQGTVKTMDNKLAGYYQDYLEELGYTQEEIDEMGQPLYIEYVSFGAVRVMFLIGVLLILLGLFIMWRKYKRMEARMKNMKSVDDLPEQA